MTDDARSAAAARVPCGSCPRRPGAKAGAITEELLALLASATGDRQWMRRAQCCAEGASHEVFFPERPDHREAQAICARCPVRADCLAENLLCEDGCFGGTTPAERRRIIAALGGRSALKAAAR